MVQPWQPLIKGSDVRSFEHTPGGTVQFAHGDDHGLGTMTVAISNSPPGGGAAEHRHPCGEVFVVYSGRGVYTVGGVDVIAEPGDLVVVPPHTWHSFRADGDMPLRHIAAYDSAHVDTEFRSGRRTAH
jgi:quercetin dioxygenase-like cupin family protein